MRKIKLYILLPILLCLMKVPVWAQYAENQGTIYSTDELNTTSDTTTLYTIRSIIIQGNDHTKEKVILRELPFEQDGQYQLNQLIGKFQNAKTQLMNTGLFQQVVVSLNSLNGYDAQVKVAVKERWYIFPIPFINVVDRSFQEWMKQDMDIKRVNYGLKLKHRNLTGVNDRLYLDVTNGYTKEVELRYENLPIDKDLKWSANIGVALGRHKELIYTTIDHRQIAYKNPESFVNTYFNSSFEIVHRPAIKTTHTFGFGYTNQNITDTIFKLSPTFSFQQNRIKYPEFYYRMQFFDVDFIPYPTEGYAADIQLRKRGFSSDVDFWQFSARTSATWPISNNYFFNLRLTGVLKFPFNQPYTMQKFIGHDGMYMQGYEDYTIDGVAGGFTKATFSRKILNTAVSIPSRFKQLNHIPIKVYGKVFGNTGYIYNQENNPTNYLNNKLLYSGGVGLDIVLLYDFTIKLEWSLNHLRQNGLYLHDRSYL